MSTSETPTELTTVEVKIRVNSKTSTVLVAEYQPAADPSEAKLIVVSDPHTTPEQAVRYARWLQYIGDHAVAATKG